MTIPESPRRLLARPLSTHLERICGALSPRRMAGLRWFWREGIFVQAAESFSADYIPLFALAAGATPTDIGILAAAANLVSVAGFLPGAMLASRLRTRKAVVLSTSYGPSRLMLPLLAALPFLVPGGHALVLLIIGVNALRIFGGTLGNAAWTSFVADLVPPSSRGRFFGSRQFVAGITALIVSPMAGLLVRALNGPSPGALAGYQATLCAAFAVGLVSIVFFTRIPEPPARTAGTRLRKQALGLASLLRRNPPFAWLAAISFLWGLGMTMSSPFYNVFMITGLGGSAASVGTMAGIFAMGGLVGQPFFGRLTDRRGNRFTLVLTGLAIPVIPFLWAVSQVPLHGYLLCVPSGLLWAGYNLAGFNILLEMSPAEDRESAFALYQTVVAVGAVIGPLLGGLLVSAAGYRLDFALSGAVRIVATFLFFWFVRPGRFTSARPGAA